MIAKDQHTYLAQLLTHHQATIAHITAYITLPIYLPQLLCLGTVSR